MHADFELNPDGGVRPASNRDKPPPGFGRGRPAGLQQGERAKLEEGDPTADPNERTRLAWRKAEALTLKEEALASQAQLKYQIDSGNYLSRDAFREASATAMAEVAQAVRSLPDLLERKANLSPEQVVLAERVIDEALAGLSATLSMFVEQSNPS